MDAAFTPAHRGGAGPPLVLLHGFTDTWRTWELVLPALERRHDVLAPTLPGHAGGPALAVPVDPEAVLDAVEAAMDAAGFATAHLAGNSLGGYVALKLAERGRARSVVAFAPAGGWSAGAPFGPAVLGSFAPMRAQVRALLPHAGALLATPEGRRRAAVLVAEHGEDLPAELLEHMMRGIVACGALEPMVEAALRDGYRVDPARIACPVRVVWGTADRLLPWPQAAVRYRTEWLPHADWVELDGVGHAPQLDAPLEAAQLVLGFTGQS